MGPQYDFRLERGIRFSEGINTTIPFEMKKKLMEIADTRLTTLSQVFRDALAAEIRRADPALAEGQEAK